MERMCSVCREVKEEEGNFRFMRHRGNYNSYCKVCERWYNKQYLKAYRERKKKEKMEQREKVKDGKSN